MLELPNPGERAKEKLTTFNTQILIIGRSIWCPILGCSFEATQTQ